MFKEFHQNIRSQPKTYPNKKTLLDSISTSQYALANVLPRLESAALQLQSFIDRSLTDCRDSSKHSPSTAIHVAHSFFKSLGKSEEKSYPIIA